MMPLRTPVSLVLIGVFNLLPLVAVVHNGWSAYDLILVYWLENLLVGAAMVARIFIHRYRQLIEIIPTCYRRWSSASSTAPPATSTADSRWPSSTPMGRAPL